MNRISCKERFEISKNKGKSKVESKILRLMKILYSDREEKLVN
jgi:hypothetical protein